MGNDNSFKTYKRPEAATISKSVADSIYLHSNEETAANLRKHNFKFGFEDPHTSSKDLMLKSEAAKRSLYEYTKNSQQDISQTRKNTEIRNRASNISWGLKSSTNRNRYEHNTS